MSELIGTAAVIAASGLCAWAWFGFTGRSSRRSPAPVPRDGQPLTERELRVFTGYVVAEQRGYPLAVEPSRRQP